MPYRLRSYDTFGAPEEWDDGEIGTYESYEEAVAVAKSGIDWDLKEYLGQVLKDPDSDVDTPGRLAGFYMASWERVSITAIDPSPDVKPGFSQSAYAVESAENLFATTGRGRRLKERGQKNIEAEKKMLAGLIERAKSGESDAALELSRWYKEGGEDGEYKIHEEALEFHKVAMKKAVRTA